MTASLAVVAVVAAGSALGVPPVRRALADPAGSAPVAGVDRLLPLHLHLHGNVDGRVEVTP